MAATVTAAATVRMGIVGITGGAGVMAYSRRAAVIGPRSS